MFLVGLSAQGASQTLNCSGPVIDDDGLPTSKGWVKVVIEDPSIASLRNLSRSQAERRIQVTSDSGYGDSVLGTRVRGETLSISCSNPAYSFHVLIPTSSVGVAGRTSAQVRMATGAGSLVGSYTCISQFTTP